MPDPTDAITYGDTPNPKPKGGHVGTIQIELTTEELVELLQRRLASEQKKHK